MLKGFKIHFKKEKVSYVITGVISGVLNGSLSMSGPPIVLFLNNEGYNKNEFRANLALYSIVTNILTIFTYIVSGLFSKHIIKISLIGVIPLILGSYFGIFMAEKIENKHFKKITLILLSENIGKDIITLRRSGFCITHLKGLYAKICNTQHRGDHMPVVILFELFCFKAVGVCNRIFRDDLAGSKPFQNRNHFGIAPV